MLRGLLGGEPARARVTIGAGSEIPIVEGSRSLPGASASRPSSQGPAPGPTVDLEILPGSIESNFQEERGARGKAGEKKIIMSFSVHAILKHRVELTPWLDHLPVGEIEAWEKDPPAPARTPQAAAARG